MAERRPALKVSVIVPVGRRQADASKLHAEYKAGLEATGLSHEIIYVLDGPQPEFAAALRLLVDQGKSFSVVSLTREFGEATALMAGFEQASGQIILTLPAYHQIQAGAIGKLLAATESQDVAIGWRWPRAGGPLERLRRGLFHGLLRLVTRLDYHDLGCGARACHRRVLEEIQLYGDQHRFLAVLADRQGFKVQEVQIAQSPQDRYAGRYRLREYARGILDIFTVFFLVRFTKKPLRFFGMLGVLTFTLGALATTWLVIERLFFGQGLAGRPALLLSALLVVLGLQLFALGLLGELIIFTHARQLRDYQIESVTRYRQDPVKPVQERMSL